MKTYLSNQPISSITARLCILQAGEVNSKVCASIPRSQDMYNALFSTIAPEITLTYIMVCDNEFPQSVDEFDAYLITGSPSGAYDNDEWIARLQVFIKTAYAANKPLIGICFGHQIIAQALGGKVEKSPKGWGVGVRTVAVKNHAGIIPEDKTEYSLLYMHQDQVVTAPTGSTVLAGDEFCPIAGFIIEDKVLCVQGHPEFTPEVIAALITLQDDVIGQPRAQIGMESLTIAHEGLAIGQWFAAFLQKTSTPLPQPS
ncbi:MAG: glutamine amidotransferase-related protein [Candidatus Puniceispirillales bacterium WSBS_2018_MAG_OTU23]